MPNFELDGITFDVVDPTSLKAQEWIEARDLNYRAFQEYGSVIGEKPMRDFTAIDRPDFEFSAARVDPHIGILQGRLREGQIFTKPLIVQAHSDEGKLVGQLYSANATSGSNPAVRYAKMYTPPVIPLPLVGGKRYAWQRELVVDPEYRRRGIALMLSYLSLNARNPKQPYSAYVSEAAAPHVIALYRKYLGGTITSIDEREMFGHGNGDWRVARIAGNVEKAKSTLAAFPGALQAIHYAKTVRRKPVL